jgi:RNA polymerase sigma-70 factor (ECF subfamily)
MVHVIRIVRNETVAQDLVQEVFLRVWTRADQWDGRGKVKGWVYRIATNLSLNHLRFEKRRPQQRLEIPADDFEDTEDFSIPGWMIDTSALTPEALRPGIVFAWAAAIFETDPLVDVDSRLFVGLRPG